jgi:hypothetical protein
VAKRLEAALGEEQSGFIEGEPCDWALVPPPDGSCQVGIDGGYVRHGFDKKQTLEVLVGKSIRRCAEGEQEDRTPSRKRLGFVHTLDTQSKRRRHAVWRAPDFPMNQESTLLSDGAHTRR